MSLLTPKAWKFRKLRRRVKTGFSTQGTSIVFGEYGLKALSNGFLSSRQLESARKVIMRSIKKTGKLWFRVFPDKPYTKKGLEMPMGSGKGEVDHYNVPIRRGKVIFEISGLDKEQAQELFRKAGHKLPVETTTVAKGEIK